MYAADAIMIIMPEKKLFKLKNSYTSTFDRELDSANEHVIALQL